MNRSMLVFLMAVMFLGACTGDDTQATSAATAAPQATAQAQVTAVPEEASSVPAASPPPVASATRGPATATRPRSTPSTATATAGTSSTTALPEPTASPLPSATAAPAPATSTPAPAPDPAAVILRLEAVVAGLESPTGIVSPGDGSGRLFILEQPGRIRIVDGGRLLEAPFLDIVDRVGSQGNEQGLLGLAFHPRYAENGRFFVNYTDRDGETVISAWSVSPDPGRAAAGSETLVLSVDQPAANHNGGHLAFGPDGYLYIGLGDGGGSGDRYGNGQNGQTLLGAMLRLDIDSALPYAIPGDNPFVADPDVRDEIWAMGLRNPWRYSFDRLTGDLYIADVGQNAYEEVNFRPAGTGGGENYGWPILEANHCFSGEGCDDMGLVPPVWEYDHSAGCSVTGGYVYRGSRYPVLQGIYLVGDFCSGTIWGLAPAADGGWQSAVVAQTDANLTSFGEDEAGELYLVDRGSGSLYHLSAQTRP